MWVPERVKGGIRWTAKQAKRAPRRLARRWPQPKAWLDLSVAVLRRLQLSNTTFVGVTGSCGKTTTVKIIGAILSSEGKCRTAIGSSNDQIRDMRLLRLSDKYCVHEVHGSAPGRIKRYTRLLRPQIGVVTTVGRDHYKNFRTLDSTALEKGQLVASLKKGGVAILNADAPYVRAMADRTAARVVTYGQASDADIMGTDISSAWPDRLTLNVHCGGDSVHVQTRLVGEYWSTSVLAAIACGIACGIELGRCAKVITAFEPVFGRCSVHALPDGSYCILDTKKAPLWTIANSLAFMQRAQAPRKTLVVGTISDYSGKGGETYRKVARQALEVVDRVIFVGPQASHVDRLRQGQVGERLFAFETSYQAAAFLGQSAATGELIYVKASITDHLERIMIDKVSKVMCWRERCGNLVECPRCKHYRRSHSAPASFKSHFQATTIAGS